MVLKKTITSFVLCLLYLCSVTLANEYFGEEEEGWYDRPEVPKTYLDTQLGNNWHYIGKKKGFLLYSSKIKGSNLLAFRGIGVLKIELVSTLQVLRDVERQVEWIPYLIQRTVMKSFDFTHLITYNLNDIPWPAANRDAFLESKLEKKERPAMVMISTRSVPGMGKYKTPPHGVIRAIIYSSHLKLVAHQDGLIADVDAHMDPKGWVPNFITNIIQESWAPNFLANLEEVSNKRKRTIHLDKVHPYFRELGEWMKKERAICCSQDSAK